MLCKRCSKEIEELTDKKAGRKREFCSIRCRTKYNNDKNENRYYIKKFIDEYSSDIIENFKRYQRVGWRIREREYLYILDIYITIFPSKSEKVYDSIEDKISDMVLNIYKKIKV